MANVSVYRRLSDVLVSAEFLLVFLGPGLALVSVVPILNDDPFSGDAIRHGRFPSCTRFIVRRSDHTHVAPLLTQCLDALVVDYLGLTSLSTSLAMDSVRIFLSRVSLIGQYALNWFAEPCTGE